MNYSADLVNYAVDSEERGQQFPAIQSSDYQPRNGSAKLDLVLNEASFDLLGEGIIDVCGGAAAFEPMYCDYGDSQTQMFKIPASLRWIVLGKPRVMKQNKETGEVLPLERGDRLAGTSWRTATRLYLCALAEDTGIILLGQNGEPQIFTLKLTSSKTRLVAGRQGDDFRSIQKLNEGICKHFGVRGKSLLHVVSVKLKASPEKFESRISGDSSWGCIFEFDGGARELPKEHWQVMADFAQSPEVKELLANPFQNASSQGNDDTPATVESVAADGFVDDSIPF